MFSRLSRAAKIYISWLYLGLLLRNAIIVATYAIIQAYNRSGGEPNWGLIYMIGALAFVESIIEHAGNAQFLALLKLIWQALQQLNPSDLQQILRTANVLSTRLAAVEERVGLTGNPANTGVMRSVQPPDLHN